LTLTVQSNVTLSGSHHVRVTGQGSEPGEHLFFAFVAETPTHATRLETSPIQGVNTDGTFALDENLTPPTDDTSSQITWKLTVVHRRGVACTTFTVP
jgi:hypothetical protein